MELLEKAWAGWIGYITQGKLAALLFAVLLAWWFGKKSEEHKQLKLYTTVMSVCCVIPVTAALIMTYQTKFYDYEWIWSMVPVTGVIAYGLTAFLAEFCGEGSGRKKSVRGGVAVACLAVLLLCGSMGADKEDSVSVYAERLIRYGLVVDESAIRREVYNVVEEIGGLAGEEEVVLWAPLEVLEYAREVDAGIRFPYGRNMWDASLNAYSYDVYDEEIHDMYIWMEYQNFKGDEAWRKELTGDGEMPSGDSCIQKALELGVNCIVLPKVTEETTVSRVAEALGGEVRQIEEYWVIYE